MNKYNIRTEHIKTHILHIKPINSVKPENVIIGKIRLLFSKMYI